MIHYNYLGSSGGYSYYNLGFGDYDPRRRKISDLTVSDNGDRDKILATVAATALEFLELHPGCRIVIRGSTPARTRLYQMKIARYYVEISQFLDVQGITAEGKLMAFRSRETFVGIPRGKDVNLGMGVLERNRKATRAKKAKKSPNKRPLDLSKDPYFVKKAESSKRLLEKVGILRP